MNDEVVDGGEADARGGGFGGEGSWGDIMRALVKLAAVAALRVRGHGQRFDPMLGGEHDVVKGEVEIDVKEPIQDGIDAYPFFIGVGKQKETENVTE